MADHGGNIPKFGDWKASDGTSPYTMYFENARKRKNNTGTTPPLASPARVDTIPGGHRTPPRAADAKPVKPKDRANRSPSQGSKAGNGASVPPWGQWNESGSGGGGQQYTLVFDQLRDGRSAPPTPSIEQLQRRTPSQATSHDLYDHAPKGFTCCGLFGK